VPTFVTTSWDDGHPDDLRLADLLAEYGIRGTFYVPRYNLQRPRMPVSDLVELSRRDGVEIGGHGLTHSRLPTLAEADARREIAGSREWLQQLLGQAVESFCYPGGEYASWMPEFVRSCGYQVGRTTRTHVFSWSVNQWAMPTSVQLYPHGGPQYLRRAVRHGNFRGFRVLASAAGRWPEDLAGSCRRALALSRRRSGLLHLWGHSWELTQLGAWAALERILRELSELEDGAFLTNAEAVDLRGRFVGCVSS
jgi:peptidoglycan/xylan/chitin deacetylase (PgdA/CDA1 family)